VLSLQADDQQQSHDKETLDMREMLEVEEKWIDEK
tara:strand:- start:266 stop:370 length:105 start_codon:yes stop_codon:yes gene_type:complete